MATEYTPNYNLDLYASADKPNLRDQYNAAMGKIDAELKNQHDDTVSANNNIGTLQTQVRNAENDIDTLQTQQGSTTSALEQLTETVNGFETQIAGKAPTNHASSATTYGAASLTQYGHVKLSDTASSDGSETGTAATPMAVSNAVAGAVDDLSGSIDSLQSGKAPTNHASAASTYGQGSPTNFGHVKVTDEAGSTAASTGTAASPTGVQNAISEWLTPTIIQLPAPSSGSWGQGMNQCAVYKQWKMFKLTFFLQLPGTGNPDYVTIATCAALGIPNPSTQRAIYAGVRDYKGDSFGQTYISNIVVKTNGDILVEGWNTIGGSRVDWDNVASIQVMIDYSQW